MKKQAALLILSASLLLSCGKQGGNHSEKSLTPSSAGEAADVSSIIKALKEAAAAPSLTVSYYEQDGADSWTRLKDVYTEDYCSFGWSNSGYVLLPSFNPAYGEKLVYSFNYDSNGEVVLGKAATYYDADDKLQGIHSCLDMNYLTLFLEEAHAPKESQFTISGSDVYSTDENIMTVMSALMGYRYGDSDVMLTSVHFGIDEAGALHFSLYHQTGEYSENEDLLLYGSFQELGTSQDDKLAAFVENYALPQGRLDEATLSLLRAKTVSFNTVISMASTSGWVDYGETTVTSEYDSSNPQEAKIAYEVKDYVNQERYTYLLTKGEDGKTAIDHYVDGENHVQSAAFKNYSWGNGIFSFQEEFDGASFLGEGGEYAYYGFNFDRLYESLDALYVLTDIYIQDVRSLSITVNGSSISFLAYIDAYYTDASGNEQNLYLKAASSFQPGSSIALPSAFEEEDEDTKAVQSAFDALKESNFVAKGHALKSNGEVSETLPTMTYYYKKDSYLIYDTTDRGTAKRTRGGYKVLEKGILPFEVNRNGIDSTGKWKPGNPVATGEAVEGDDLFAHLGFTASGMVFTKGANAKEYVLKPNVKRIASSIIGGSTKDSLIDTSLSLTLDEAGRLAKIRYQYVFGGILAGKEEIVFTYYEAADFPFPADILSQESFDALTGDLPTSWLGEASANVVQAFKKLYGDEAANVPYLADSASANHWELTPNYYDSTGDYCFYNNFLDDAYQGRYVALLEEKGFSKQTISDVEYYVKGKVKVRWASINGSLFLFFGVVSE